MRLNPVKWAFFLVLTFFPAASGAAETPSLCTASEKAYFSCVAGGGRLIALCGSPALSQQIGYLQYRYGSASKVPELVFPLTLKHPKGSFEFVNETFSATSSARNLRFKIGTLTYVVYSTTTFGSNSAGVAARGNGPWRHTACKTDIDDRDLHLLQNVGLPAIRREELVFEP